MTTKTPTASGVSRLLAAAGFPKSVMTNSSRHHKEHTEGFHVKTFLGEVIVTWWHDSSRNLFGQHEEDIVRGREMQAQYAEAIRAAGWPVREKTGSLIVTAKTEKLSAQQYGIRWGADNDVVFAYGSRPLAEAALGEDGRSIGILVVHEYEPGTPNSTEWREVAV